MGKSADFHWDDLRYFLRASQAKSLAGAARTLCVEHTTVGRRLSALEQALGAPLVLRGPDGLQLTALGEKVRPVAEQVDQLLADIKDLVTADRPAIRLAVPSGFTPIFAAALGEARKSPLGFSLAIVSGARPVDLRRGEADLAIRSAPMTDERLVAGKICDAGFSLYASPAYLARRPAPHEPHHLAGHEVIGFDASLAGSRPAKWLAEHAVGAHIVLRGREMTDVRSAALSGISLAVLPCLLGDEEPGLERLTPQVLTNQSLFLAYLREARRSGPLRAASRFVREIVQRHRTRLSGLYSAAGQDRRL